jgi:hypothetical protein
MRSLRIAALLLALLLPGTWVASCGSGESPDETPCVMPGTLRALAVQGQPAPGTVGNYGAFAAAGLAMDVAPNGWSVFVASTTDPAKPNALFVARPDGVVLLVWSQGETVPDAAGGTISGFPQQALEVTSDGRILVQVNIAGDLGGRTFGLLSARVDGPGGAVVEKNDVVYAGDDLSATGVTGTLTSLFGATTFQADDGRVFFHGETSTGLEGFWRSDADGTDKLALVFETQALPGGGNVAEIDTLGIDRQGLRFAVVLDRSGGGEAIYSATPGGPLDLLASDGQPLTAPTGGGNILDVWDSGPLLVYSTGAVVWQGTGNKPIPDDILFYNGPGASGFVLARSGDSASGSGGGTYGIVEPLNNARDATFAYFRTVIVGGPVAGIPAIYAVTSLGVPASPVVGEGSIAPASAGGGTIGDTFPGLSVPGRDDSARNTGLVFANLLSTGKSATFWIIPNCGFFTLVLQDTPAPGGDTFGTFFPNAAHTTADGVVLFRALLNTAGSGIFRQGP